MSTETMTPAPEASEVDTTERLAQLGDDIQKAQEERWKREQAEKAAQRQRTFAENRIRQIDAEIPNLEAAIAERKPAVDRLDTMFDKQRDKVASILDERDHVPMSRVGEYNAAKDYLQEIARALSQAKLTGSELVEGVSATEGGGGLMVSYSPMSRRINHPLLQEIAGDVDWSTPLQPLVERLEELQAERAKLTKRLGK